MIRTLAAAVLAAILGFGAYAAQPQPLYNVSNSPITPAFHKDPAPIIEQALSGRSWTITARRPGAIDATISVRTHRADITVSYTATSYSIVYRDSENLDYKDGAIHPNYNRWIGNLDFDIQRALLAAAEEGQAEAAGGNKDLGLIVERTLINRGWKITDRRPGVLDANIVVRGGSPASIEVTYTSTDYNISYTGDKAKVPMNYDRWVGNLKKDIQAELAPPAPAAK
jgi:hypothetical protein